ncbi:putative Late nodulin [Medicago truncatula]|uniref:Putative Late nodulin n=1 Tax=Medicago truncatula TaxID=3880 RepID=A0A396H980_MEDTR|nr:putative Late nodulin [Medicago truncatula]
MRINMTAAILKFVYTIIIYLFLLRVVAKDLPFNICEKDEDCLEFCAHDKVAKCMLNICFCF